MAFTAANLHLRAGAPGDLSYTYDAGSDTMATVAASGYFNNTDDDQNFVADDRIWCQCTDGNMLLRVSAVSSGTVTTQHAGGNLPLQTPATGTDATLSAAVAVGHYEIGTSIATASRYVLPTPYAGAEIIVRKDDSGSQIFEFDAGGSGATGVTYDSVGNRRISLQNEGEGFHVVGVSATRWRIYSLDWVASGASNSPLAGASRAIAGT